MKLFLANARGFCAGVDRAVAIVAPMPIARLTALSPGLEIEEFGVPEDAFFRLPPGLREFARSGSHAQP